MRRKLAFLMALAMLTLTGLSTGASAEFLTAPSSKKFKFDYDPTFSSGPIDKDDAAPTDVKARSLKIYNLYRKGKLEQGLKEMRSMLAWIEAKLPRLSASRARSNLWMGVLLQKLGKPDQAITFLSESVDILSTLSASDPSLKVRLVDQMTYLSETYSQAGRHPDAFAIQEKAVKISGELSETVAGSIVTQFSALQVLANRYTDLDRDQDALAIRKELAITMRKQYRINPDRMTLLIFAEYAIVVHYTALDRDREAEAAAGVIASICQEAEKGEILASVYPSLAICHSTLGVIRMLSKDWLKSLASIEKAIEINRVLAGRDSSYLGMLARSLGNASVINQQLGRLPQALLHAEEAVDTSRKLETLKSGEPDFFDYTFRMTNYIPSLQVLGGLQLSTGQPEQARATFDELISILRPLAAVENSFRVTLLEVLNTVEDLNRKEGIETGAIREITASDLSLLPRNDPATPLKRAVVRLWPTFNGKSIRIGLLGTGFVVRRKGDRAWIATALHVVRHPQDNVVATKLEAELYTGPLPPGFVRPRLEVVLNSSTPLPERGDEPILLEVRGLPRDVQPLGMSVAPPEGVLTVVGHPSSSYPWTVGSYPLLKASPILVLDGRLDEGASGSPVLTQSGQVVGLVYRSTGEGEPVPLVYAYPSLLIQGKLP
jgi:tetratricopeptide (TPR) repeat protein